MPTSEVCIMFSFTCAHCGYREILHNEDSSLRDFAKTNLWPNDEYQEDPEEKISAQSEVTHKRGYRYSLSSCPNFKYREKDRSEVIDEFSQKEHLVGYLPDSWKDRALQKHAKRVEREENSASGPLYIPTATYIFYDPNNGRSYVAYGD